MDRFWNGLQDKEFRVIFNDGSEFTRARITDHDDDASWFIMRLEGGDKFDDYDDVNWHDILVPGWNVKFFLPVPEAEVINLT